MDINNKEKINKNIIMLIKSIKVYYKYLILSVWLLVIAFLGDYYFKINIFNNFVEDAFAMLALKGCAKNSSFKTFLLSTILMIFFVAKGMADTIPYINKPFNTVGLIVVMPVVASFLLLMEFINKSTYKNGFNEE